MLKEIKKNWQPLLGCVLFAVPFFATNPDLMRHQIFLGSMVAVIAFAIFLGQALKSWIPAAAFTYFAWNCVRIFTVFPQYEDWSIQASAQSFAFLLCVMLIVMLVTRRERGFLFETLATIAFGTSIWLIAMRFFTKQPYAFTNNPAADGSILAVLYPILVLRENWLNKLALKKGAAASVLLAVLPLIAIGCTHSSTAVAAAVVAIAWLAFFQRKEKMFLLGAGILAAIPLLSIPFFIKSSYFNDNGRISVWKLMGDFWWQKVDPIFGMGGGTFFYAGPKVQKGMGYPIDGLFAVLHNDYLQTAFEQGVVGLALLLLVGTVALRRSLDRNWLYAALFTYGFIMLAQYPLRFFASAMIGALLIREAYETTRKT